MKLETLTLPLVATTIALGAQAADAPKAATPTTEQANAAMRQTVGSFDPRDFEDATRGKLAELDDPLDPRPPGAAGP